MLPYVPVVTMFAAVTLPEYTPVVAVTCVALTLPVDTLPVTDKVASVPTLVKLDAVTVEFNVEPLNVPAGATTAAVVIEEIRPQASVVTTGIAVELPVATAPGPLSVKLIALPEIVTLPAPVLE